MHKNRHIFSSFYHAFNGITESIKQEKNMLLHFIIAFAVVVVSICLNVNTVELCMVLYSISLVIIAELVNTAIEKVADMITKEKCMQIKIIKDISAAAVLVAAISAVAIGSFIILPKIFNFF